jgi:hypothetical protein
MKILLWLLTLAAGGYGALATLMYFGQRSLLYFPEQARTAPAAAGLPAAEEVVLDTSDGEQVVVWHRPRKPASRSSSTSTATPGRCASAPRVCPLSRPTAPDWSR